jgi:hypothetical protein
MSSLPSLRVFLVPALLLLIAYWPVWDVWFRADDFAWLGLRLPVKDLSTLLTALFQPMAQGTVRFLSERAFFLTFSSIFGVDPLPMRIFIFLLQLASIALVVRLCWRLSGSWATAALVPCLWLLNPGTVVSMTWLSTWNQLLVVFFLLAALVSFIERRMWLCWISYLLGFGALEVNIVFPGLLLAYVWLYERERLREVWLFFVPSLLFVAIHLLVIPKNKQDPTYQLFLDADLPRRLSRYWKWGLGFWRYVDLVGGHVRWERIGSPMLSVLGLGGLAWAGWNYWRKVPRGRLALFGVAWFVGLLLPVLPLRNHFSDYYLASASVGMAMILAVAVVEAWNWHKAAGGAATVAICFLVFVSWEVRAATIGWYRSHSQAVERLTRGVVEARRLHPNDVVLLDGVDNSLFWDGMLDDPFRLYLVFDVFLTPGSERRLSRSIAGDDLTPYVFPPEDTRFLLEHEAVQVYRIEPGPLRNVTRTYHREQDPTLPYGTPRFIDVAKSAYQGLLGPGWHPVDNRARWSGGKSELKIGGPKSAGQALRMTGYAPELVLGQGPQVLTVTANGKKLPPVTFTQANVPFSIAIPLPQELIDVPQMNLQLSFSRVIMQRGREHALIVRRIEVR